MISYMNNNLLTILLLISFFIVRILMKIMIDKDLDNFFIENTNYDNVSREIIENGISISFAFLIISIIHKYLLRNFKINSNPYKEFISIVIGTIITIILYKLYKYITNKELILLTRIDRDKNKDNIVD